MKEKLYKKLHDELYSSINKQISTYCSAQIYRNNLINIGSITYFEIRNKLERYFQGQFYNLPHRLF